MSKPARLCDAEPAEFIPCERPFSNYSLVENRFKGIRTLRRILSQVRMHGAKTIVVEHLLEATDLQEEDEDISGLRPDFKPEDTVSSRLSFFTDTVSEANIKSIDKESFIGYAIYKEDTIKARVYESVIRASKRDNNFVHGAPLQQCAVASRVFTVSGYLYAQQNGVTNSCAHVAARTVATRFSNGDISYRQMNEWVSEYRSANSIAESPPGKGLTNNEICYILQQAGAKTLVGDYACVESPPVPYQLHLYGSVESGFPGIIFFGTEEETDDGNIGYHVVPIFGHTFNEDTWVSDAEHLYFPLRKATKCLTSGSWVSMFVGHDDNSGSNYCIPPHYMEPHRICRDEKGNTVYDGTDMPISCKQQRGSVVYAIGTLPVGIELDPIAAEAIAAQYLFAILRKVPDSFPGWKEHWQKRLAKLDKDGELLIRRSERLVLRTTLHTGLQYTNHLKAVKGWNREKTISSWLTESMSSVADDPFWVVEVSLPELFSANRRKVGEILVRADRQPATGRDFTSFLLARLPGCFVLLQSLESGNTPGEEPRPKFCYVPVEIDDHVELIGCEDEA